VWLLEKTEDSPHILCINRKRTTFRCRCRSDARQQPGNINYTAASAKQWLCKSVFCMVYIDGYTCNNGVSHATAKQQLNSNRGTVSHMVLAKML
jgi:hypothetical protein